MYHPFPLLTTGLLKDQVARGKCYFVRQHFPRGLETGLKAAFLFRAYFAEEQEMAERHLVAIAHDRYAFLYDANDPLHLEKLHHAAMQPAGYRIFYAAKKGVDWKPPENCQEKMKEYIRRNHPAWRTKRGGEKIEIGLYEEFGELFLKFSYGKENDTIPFDLIEKY